MTLIVLDKYLESLMVGLEPHHSVADLHKSGHIGDQIRLPKPFITTLDNWFRCPCEDRTVQQENFLTQLTLQ